MMNTKNFLKKKSNGTIGIYNFDDISSNRIYNENEEFYVMNKFNVKNLYESLLFRAKIAQCIGSRICIDCINKIGFNRYKYNGFVTCSLCNKHYDVMFENVNNIDQGDGCNCEIFDTFIGGSYGSKYDETALYFVKDKPSYLSFKSSICNNCVNRLITENICVTI